MFLPVAYPFFYNSPGVVAMKLRWTIVGIVLFLIISEIGLAAARPRILEMRTCRGVKEWQTSFDAQDWTYQFTTQDKYIYCVVKVEIPWSAGKYTGTIEWYTPNNTLYDRYVFKDLDDGAIWSLAGHISLTGDVPTGQWKVTFSMNHAGPRKTLFFTINPAAPRPNTRVVPPATTVGTPPASAPSAQPVTGTWQLGRYTLKVADSIKYHYAYGRAHVTLILNRPGSKDWIIVDDVEVDTGADTTMLPEEVGDKLGIDLQSGHKVNFSGVTGADVGWEHQVKIGIIFLGGAGGVDGYILGKNGSPLLFTIPIIFYGTEKDNSASKLLGRTGVLSVLNLSFGERMLTITVRPPE